MMVIVPQMNVSSKFFVVIKIKGIDGYPGGKSGAGTYQKIINEIRPHHQLVIPFLGNCAIIRNISRAFITIGIDACSQIISKWSTVELDRIDLINDCGIKFLENEIFKNPGIIETNKLNCPFFSGNTVIYCDPPYPIESRSTKREIYKYEMNIDDHERLLKAIKKQCCDVLISTYENDLYKDELKDWRLKKFMSMTRGGLRQEYLYMNYPEPDELHDYSFLGHDYRERERISKKIKRHVDRLMSLPVLERKAILKNLVSADNDKSVDNGSLTPLIKNKDVTR